MNYAARHAMNAALWSLIRWIIGPYGAPPSSA